MEHFELKMVLENLEILTYIATTKWKKTPKQNK